MKTLREQREKEKHEKDVMERMAKQTLHSLYDNKLLFETLVILAKDWIERHKDDQATI